MIYFVSNRNITDDSLLFGDNFNAQGAEVLRVAKAVQDNEGNFSLALMDEAPIMHNGDIADEVQTPLEAVFEQCDNADSPCVLFVHGFNQDIKKNLKKCREIEAYGVNVIAFSWPSNPGPNFILRKISEYKRARKNARRSAMAFERLLDKLNGFVETNRSKTRKQGQIQTLAIHSLGNYLMQSMVQVPDYDHQAAMFKNILLHQADADNPGHASWLDTLGQSSRVLVTVNETDDVLDFSDFINPDRIGNTAANMTAQYATYYNFTDAAGANDSHRLWHKPAVENPTIKHFFSRVFDGKNPVKAGMQFNGDLNCYNVI
ncbi:alpha/beta hydrolase [Photobacterium swingsii]|uniref:alpha/beta hydrolase n=1 Tax=Photobacterium swingsii TaxID=680026 RepID=UPI00354F0D60